MSTTVSNDSASAAEEVLSTPQSLDEAIETGFLPDDEHYRLTGQFKSEKPDDAASSTGKEKTPPAKQDASAASEQQDQDQDDASKAAASATAQTQRTEPRRETRWEKRERELKEARAEIARLKSQSSQPERRSETAQPSPAATETQAEAGKAVAEPKIDDLDATGKPKFKTLNDFLSAHAKWNREEAIKGFREESTKTAQQQEFAAIDKSRAEHVEKVRAAHPDYDQTVKSVIEAKEADGRSPIFYTTGSHIDNFLLAQPDRGAGLLYHLMKNVSDPAVKAIFARIPDGTRYQLTNVEQISRLAVLAHTLAASTASRTSRSSQAESPTDDSSSVRPVTRASRPPHQVSGQGTVAKDAVEQALDDGDFETYQRTQNAKELARLKRK
jgi:hypothetical protein